MKDTEANKIIELRWEGPFRWPGSEGKGEILSLADTPAALGSGVYLWTIAYLDGFLIYAAGITRRPFIRRFREHTVSYRTGIYTLFDIPSLQQGVRKELWHGFWSRRRPVERIAEYDRRREELRIAAEKQLSAYRVFVARLETESRVLQRVEAAIMSQLYAAPGLTSAIPDRGMALAPRWQSERPFVVRCVSNSVLHALPRRFLA